MSAPILLDPAQLAAIIAEWPALKAKLDELERRLNPEEDPDAELTVEQAVAELGRRGVSITDQGIYKRIKRGQLPYRNVEGKRSIRIRRGDLLKAVGR